MNLNLIVKGLAAWRITNILVNEDGPNNVFSDLREKTGIEYTEEGEVFKYPAWNPFGCTLCASVWVGILVYFMPNWLSEIFCISAIVALLEKLNGKSEN